MQPSLELHRHLTETCMSKILVIVYSYTGIGRELASLLCARQGGLPRGDVFELRPRAGAWASCAA